MYSALNIYGGKNIAAGTLVAIWINGIRTDLNMTINTAGTAEFEGGILRPSIQKLKALQLQKGRNLMEVRLICPRTLMVLDGDLMSTCADLWLWDSEEDVVVVDIDGTITKSDVRGFVATNLQGAVSDTAAFLCSALSMSNRDVRQSIMPTALSKDYVHDGVSEAISFLSQIGCRIFYLTARPITWVGMTRSFLTSVGRGSGATMPDGAVVTIEHPTARALTVSHEEFKTRVLHQVGALFAPLHLDDAAAPPRRVPFAAGFGNHMTDVGAYAACGVPPDRIFLLDRTSKLVCWGTRAEYQSYRGLLPALRDMFADRSLAAAQTVQRDARTDPAAPRSDEECSPPAPTLFLFPSDGGYSPRRGSQSPLMSASGPSINGRARPAAPPAAADGRGRGWGTTLLGNVISSCTVPRRDFAGSAPPAAAGRPAAGGPGPQRPGYDDRPRHVDSGPAQPAAARRDATVTLVPLPAGRPADAPLPPPLAYEGAARSLGGTRSVRDVDLGRLGPARPARDSVADEDQAGLAGSARAVRTGRSQEADGGGRLFLL
jgi:hypothetical protein